MIVSQLQRLLDNSPESKRVIAQRAGVRPELLSRLGCQRSCDLLTLEKIARAMNLEIVIRPAVATGGTRPIADVADAARTSSAGVRTPATVLSKAQRLGLTLPYDWSNPDIPDRALILKALEFAHLPDLTRLALHFGMAALETALAALPEAMAQSAARVLPNIRAALTEAGPGGAAA